MPERFLVFNKQVHIDLDSITLIEVDGYSVVLYLGTYTYSMTLDNPEDAYGIVSAWKNWKLQIDAPEDKKEELNEPV